MIEIGVQTKGILLEKPLDMGLEMVSKAGFTKLDFNLDCFLKNSDIYSGKINKFFDSSLQDMIVYFSNFKAAFERHGLTVSQMHAPYPFFVRGKSSQNDYMMGNVIPKSLVIAETLGCEWTVVHPAKLQYYEGIEAERKINLDFYKMLIPILKQCKVKVCIENLYEGIGTRLVEGPCSNPEDAIYYVDTLNDLAGEELFGICLDTGHLQLTKRRAEDYIKRVGRRIKILHLHENDAVGDLHQMPYTFDCNRQDKTDWNEIAKALKGIDFQGTLSFETFPCMNSFIDGLDEAVLKTIYDIGDDLRRRIEQA